ncbi:MAG: YcbK family protein [Akkermansiaceae bacterium]
MKKTIIDTSDCGLPDAASSDAPFLVGGGIPECLKPTNRRKFLAAAGITTAGVIIGAPRSEAAFFGLIGDKPVPGIPHAWVQAKGSDVLRYAKFIQKLRLRNITPRMVLAPHFKTRGSVQNSIPPKSYWKKMAPTLKVIDKMITRIGAPLKEITSAYRSPRYNRAVGGKSKSYHMQNMACDIQFRGVSPYHAAYVAKQLRSQGYYKGGIGRYSSFVHVDTRGTNVDW